MGNAHRTFMVQSCLINDEELLLLSRKNPGLRFERNADGTLKTTTPTGKISGNREAKAIAYLLTWVENNARLLYLGLIYPYALYCNLAINHQLGYCFG